MRTRAYPWRLAIAVIALIPGALFAQSQTESSVTGDEAGPAPVPLKYCDHTSGFQVNSPADADNFVFDCDADDEIRVTVSGRTNNLDPCAAILGPPLGDPIGELCCAAGTYGTCSFIIDATCTTSGVHRVTVDEWNADNSGSYVLQLEQLPTMAPPAYGSGIPYDSVRSESLTPHTDLDLFFFKGRAGTSIDAIVSGRTNNLDLRLEIWDPAGTLIATTTCAAGTYDTCSISEGPVAITESGTHLIGISEWYADNTGNYELSVQCHFGNCPYGYFLGGLTVDSNGEVCWDSVLDLSTPAYDLVRGDLQALRTHEGNYTPTVIECALEAMVSTEQRVCAFTYDDDPLAGAGFYYLARVNADVGAAFFDTAALSQVGGRDAEINDSPNACPLSP